MSKKQAREAEEKKRQSRKRLLTVAVALATVVIVIAIAYFVFFYGQQKGHVWRLDDAGLLRFDARPAVSASALPLEATPNGTLEKVTYDSAGTTVYALLRIPANVSRPPAVIVLPAASINKEADADMAKALAARGYATLTLDERGNNGETAGPSPMDLQKGYDAFQHDGDPVQYLQVYDVLRGYDYVRARPDLDGDNVAVLGESMGGRFAIVAAALEPGLKGVVGVSTGPYGIQGSDESLSRFARSIEPANYLASLPPRRLVMFHFVNDSIIPISAARQLYDVAHPPKAWHEYNGTVHGLYSDTYAPDLYNALEVVFGR